MLQSTSRDIKETETLSRDPGEGASKMTLTHGAAWPERVYARGGGEGCDIRHQKKKRIRKQKRRLSSR